MNIGIAITSQLSNMRHAADRRSSKIERQDTNLVWTDVTTEILGYDIGAANVSVCGSERANAIIRLQRVADVPPSVAGGGCANAVNLTAADYWPLALFDAREGLVRDVAPVPANPILGGVMYYVQLDVRNLSRWFQGIAPYAAGSGPGSKWNNGFSVYFSDRRNNRNGVNETGEYGFEDVVNPQTAAGTPNGILTRRGSQPGRARDLRSEPHVPGSCRCTAWSTGAADCCRETVDPTHFAAGEGQSPGPFPQSVEAD
jgi:hypothetical protein